MSDNETQRPTRKSQSNDVYFYITIGVLLIFAVVLSCSIFYFEQIPELLKKHYLILMITMSFVIVTASKSFRDRSNASDLYERYLSVKGKKEKEGKENRENKEKDTIVLQMKTELEGSQPFFYLSISIPLVLICILGYEFWSSNMDVMTKMFLAISLLALSFVVMTFSRVVRDRSEAQCLEELNKSF